MSRMKLLALGALIAAYLCCATEARRPWWARRKATCPPAYKVNVQLRPQARPNFLQGRCSISGNRRDTCRRRMSCCENSQGVQLCIRARVYKPQYRKPENTAFPELPPPPPPPPVQNNMMLNDMDIGSNLCLRGAVKECRGNEKARTKCYSFMDCAANEMCCQDPCYKGRGISKVCMKSLSNSNFDNFGLNGGFVQDIQMQPISTQRPSKKRKSEKTTTEGPPTSPVVSANLVVDEEIHNSCPKPDIKCNADGTECAVGCPAYDKSYTECENTSDCAQDRICCQDPCPNSPLKLCFPDNKEKSKRRGKVVKSQARLNLPPPPVLPIIADEENSHTAKNLRQLECPVGDYTSCIGWVAEPGKNGTGTCKSNDDCANDRVCCKITECFDNTKHCVKQISPEKLREECSPPSYFKFTPTKKDKLIPCKSDKDCKSTGSKVCCHLDIHGTQGCKAPA